MSPILRRNDPAVSYPTPSSAAQDTTFRASFIIGPVCLLLLVLWTIAIYLFAPGLRQQYIEYRARKQAKKNTDGGSTSEEKGEVFVEVPLGPAPVYDRGDWKEDGVEMKQG